MSAEPNTVQNVTWCATSPETGRLGQATRSSLREAAERFRELRDKGQGYLEVWKDDRSSLLALSFLGHRAVIQLRSGASDRSWLLVGDGTEVDSAAVEVPVMDELAVFSGAFVQHVDRAWVVVQEFVRSKDASRLGEWYEL